MSQSPPDLLHHRLPGGEAGPYRIIDAQVQADGSVRHYIGLSGTGRRPELTAAPDGARLAGLPGGALLSLPRPPDRAGGLELDGFPVDVTATPAQTELLAGLDVILGVRHAESADATAEWLAFHSDEGAQAALILDRGDPAEGAEFRAALAEAMRPDRGPGKVVVVTTDAPLGQKDLPPHAHPFNAPAAPGKPRMDLPPPDPWRAPLDDTLIYEALHRRFLSEARAVLCLDVCDLLLPSPGPSLFDACRKAGGGFLSLTGREAYPWRLRKDRPATFGDHICTQFDQPALRRRWAIVPEAEPRAVWRMTRVVGPQATDSGRSFLRCMAVRHPGVAVSELVPKSGLVEDPDLIDLATTRLRHDPVRAPSVALRRTAPGPGHTTIVTCMKDEGPFILEWLAYHRAIGIDRVLVYSNDCSDGTDRILDLLQDRGLVTHRDNPYRATRQKPQHAALAAAESEPLIEEADWLICMDVDEFLNVHAGEGRIADLYAAAPDATMISATWRLFGNADIVGFRDRPILEQFTRCAPEFAPKPHQAWGFKTLFRHDGRFRKLGVHRPKGLVPQLKDGIVWVNGSGQAMPEAALRTAWRSTTDTYGYGLVTLNHYACRSVDSFLVKRDRGRVNHVGRDQGLKYWFRMNNNAESDTSIQRLIPAMRAERDRLLSDGEIADAHAHSVAHHRARIDALRDLADYAELHDRLSGARMRRLSRLHPHFGSGVFWSGPDVVPDEVADRDPADDFFFTVKPTGSGH